MLDHIKHKKHLVDCKGSDLIGHVNKTKSSLMRYKSDMKQIYAHLDQAVLPLREFSDLKVPINSL